jgi:hypothetical protein
VAGELARDGDRDDRAPLAASLEGVPALMQPACALVGSRADRGGLPLATLLEHCARAQRSPLLPGGLDQQPAGMRIAGLCDRAEAAPLAGRVLARGEAEEGACGRKRVQSPSSTVNASAVSVPTPRRQLSRPTISTNGGSPASVAIAWSSASRRVFACTTAP